MTYMTLALPEEVHGIMKKHQEVKWSEIARQAIWNHARKIQLMNQLLEKSELTEEDAERIGEKIKKEVAKKHGLKG